MTEEKLIEIAEYYIENKVSINELAQKFKFSKATIVRYFNKEKLIRLPFYLQVEVDKLKRQNWIDGKSTSGNMGNKKFNDKQLVYLAQIYSTGDYTLRELATPFEVSPATLYNNFTQEVLGEKLYLKVKEIYEKNRENKIDRRTK